MLHIGCVWDQTQPSIFCLAGIPEFAELSSQFSGTIQPAFRDTQVGGMKSYKSLISNFLSPPGIKFIIS